MVGKKPAFGGYSINFAGQTATVEQVFGKTPIAPSEMTNPNNTKFGVISLVADGNIAHNNNAVLVPKKIPKKVPLNVFPFPSTGLLSIHLKPKSSGVPPPNTIAEAFAT